MLAQDCQHYRPSSVSSQRRDPNLPDYIRLREKHARVPKPIEHQGILYDVMGVTSQNELLLCDQHAAHQDVRVENFAGRSVLLRGNWWHVVALEVLPGLTPVEAMEKAKFLLVDPCLPSLTMTVDRTDLSHLRFPGTGGEYMIGLIKHGIMRMRSTVSRASIRVHLRTGQQFEARLRYRELEGPFLVEMSNKGQLMATRKNHDGNLQRMAVMPAEIVPRYRRLRSSDFGTFVDIDAFVYHEDQLRCRASNLCAGTEGGPVYDPLLGSLSAEAMPQLTNGADHLAVFERFIRNHAPPKCDTTFDASLDLLPRRLTVLNLSISNQGKACGVFDALVDFREQNPGAKICVVVSKLGPTEFQESPAFAKYLSTLADNHIEVDDYTGVDGPTRQVMHGKAIIIDDKVLFSTGAIMDIRPIDKADFSIELPDQAAEVFRKYTVEAVHRSASYERRAELAAELASIGVVINDPVAGLTYVSRTQDALIRGARQSLTISMSELIDPTVTRALINRAASGISVIIQVRELDLLSARLLAKATTQHSNLRLEDSSWWEPRPHFNVIIADGCAAYLGSSYLWSTQRNMIHQGRSFENGVLLGSSAASQVLILIDQLRTRAFQCQPMAKVYNLYKSWSLTHPLWLKYMFVNAMNSKAVKLFTLRLMIGLLSWAGEEKLRSALRPKVVDELRRLAWI